MTDHVEAIDLAAKRIEEMRDKRQKWIAEPKDVPNEEIVEMRRELDIHEELLTEAMEARLKKAKSLPEHVQERVDRVKGNV